MSAKLTPTTSRFIDPIIPEPLPKRRGCNLAKIIFQVVLPILVGIAASLTTLFVPSLFSLVGTIGVIVVGIVAAAIVVAIARTIFHCCRRRPSEVRPQIIEPRIQAHKFVNSVSGVESIDLGLFLKPSKKTDDLSSDFNNLQREFDKELKLIEFKEDDEGHSQDLQRHSTFIKDVKRRKAVIAQNLRKISQFVMNIIPKRTFVPSQLDKYITTLSSPPEDYQRAEILLNVLKNHIKIDTLVDENGDSLIHQALKTGHLLLAHLLVKTGANMLEKNRDGRNGFDLITQFKEPALMLKVILAQTDFETIKRLFNHFLDLLEKGPAEIRPMLTNQLVLLFRAQPFRTTKELTELYGLSQDVQRDGSYVEGPSSKCLATLGEELSQQVFKGWLAPKPSS